MASDVDNSCSGGPVTERHGAEELRKAQEFALSYVGDYSRSVISGWSVDGLATTGRCRRTTRRDPGMHPTRAHAHASRYRRVSGLTMSCSVMQVYSL